MTKKDYQAIAWAIHDARKFYSKVPEVARAIGSLSWAIADVMAQNQHFDRERFIEACETGRCKGMPK